MLHQLHNMPKEQPFILACSGGVDSMAIADFYKRGGKQFTVAYFNHGTPQADLMEELVCDWVFANGVSGATASLREPKPAGLSPEEHWRNERYKWLHSFNLPVVTCHHLNDAAETWLFYAMNGMPKLIAPAIEGGGKWLYRPFLTNTKQDLIDWCVKHEVKWFEDPSNQDVTFPRNRVRHNILPEVLKINPGFLKVLKKKYLSQSR
jgi:tRNA(Ile)-lysidine synthase